MSFESDLHAALTSEATISALIGSRLYPLTLVQGAASPAIVYQRVSDQSEEDLDGAVRLEGVRIQFDIYASTYPETITVRGALQDFLQGYKGTMGSTRIESCHYLDDSDSHEPEMQLFRSSIDFEIWYQR